MNKFDPFDHDDSYAGDSSELEGYEQYLNVRGLLANRFGAAMGDEIYSLLLNAAQAVSDQIDIPTVPGILFKEDEPNGEFVGFEIPDDEYEDDDYDPELDFLQEDPIFDDDDEDSEGF